jgi:hypothetical protein
MVTNETGVGSVVYSNVPVKALPVQYLCINTVLMYQVESKSQRKAQHRAGGRGVFRRIAREPKSYSRLAADANLALASPLQSRPREYFLVGTFSYCVYFDLLFRRNRRPIFK